MSLFDEGLMGPDVDPESYVEEGEEVVTSWYPERPELVIATQDALRFVGRLDDDRGLSTRLALDEVVDVGVETDRSLPAYLGVRLAVAIGAAALAARALSLVEPQVALLAGAFAIVLLAGSIVAGRRAPTTTTVTVRTVDGGQRDVEFTDEDDGESFATHVDAFSS